MRYFFWLSCLLLMAIMAGCVMERVVWSPDGSCAAVLGDDGLHLCDVAGKLSPVLAPNAKCVEWLPDSKRLVVCSQRLFKTWKEASEALPDDAAAARKNADAVRAELSSASDDWSTFVYDTAKKLHLTNEQLVLASMYLRDSAAEAFPLKLNKKGKESFAEQWISEDLVQVYHVDTSTATAGTTLYRRANAGNGIKSVRVSPTGAAVLLSSDVSIPRDHGEPLELLLAPTDGSQKICDLGREAEYPDWSPDGKYVVFIRPADWHPGQDETVVGILTRQLVTEESGRFFDQEHLPKREDLAGLLFGQLSRVRVAKDGRIFFCASEISLPAGVQDIDTQATIFCFEPGKQSTLTRVVPRGAAPMMGDAAQYFELSPDARYLCVPFDDARVSVLDIASGQAQMVQSVAEPESKDRLRLATVPEWRTATELTFVRPIANSTAHEVVRYSVPEKSATVISAAWPASIGNWLAEQPKPDVPAATSAKH